MTTHNARYFEDCAQAPAGHLVVLEVPSLGVTTFAISCDNRGTRMFAALSDVFNTPVPAVGEFVGKCLSLGNEFVVGFDPNGSTFAQQPAPGNLVITANAVFMIARMAAGGTRCFVDLATGAITGTKEGAVIPTWALSVDTWQKTKPPVTIFARPPQSG